MDNKRVKRISQETLSSVSAMDIARIMFFMIMILSFLSLEAQEAEAQSLAGKTIAIDAGHGTINKNRAGDPCQSGAAGEADIVQDVALKLKQLIEKAGGKAVLTRDTDCSGGQQANLESRAKKAIDQGADIIIDIHSDCTNCKGSKIIIDCPSAKSYRDKCDWNSVNGNDRGKKLGGILGSKFSQISNAPLKSYGQYLYFLRKASESQKATTALVELSNSNDKRLGDDAFRQKTAQMIFDSITEYLGAPQAAEQGQQAAADLNTQDVVGDPCTPGSGYDESLMTLSEGAGINVQEGMLSGGQSFVVTLDPNMYELKVVTAQKVAGKKTAALPEIMKGVKEASAGINGGYFEPSFAPSTDMVEDGKLIKGEGSIEEANFFVVEDGIQKIIPASMFYKYDERQLKTIASAISGFMSMLSNGNIGVKNDEEERQRSSLCITYNGEIKLVAVEKATPLKFAEFLKEQQNCKDAIALEGGSSVSLEYDINDKHVSIGSDGEFTRFSGKSKPIPVAVVAVKKAKASAQGQSTEWEERDADAGSGQSGSSSSGSPTGNLVAITGMPTAAMCPDFSSTGGKEKKFFESYWGEALKASDGAVEIAKFTMAQAALESGWGESGLAKNANNFFGVKGKGDAGSYSARTREVYGGKETYIVADFAKYSTPAEGFKAHQALLEKERYVKKREDMFGTSDMKKLRALQILEATWKAGYATDPVYIQKVSPIIKKLDDAAGCLGGFVGMFQEQKPLDCMCNPPAGSAAAGGIKGVPVGGSVSQIIDEMTRKYYNTKYVLGGSNPGQGIDCSGWVSFLVNTILESRGMVRMSRGHGPTAQDWENPKYTRMITETELRPGDIILLDRPSGGTNNWMAARTWDHIVIAYEKNGQLWVSESSGGSHLKDNTYDDFIKYRRGQQSKRPGYRIGFARPVSFDSFTGNEIGVVKTSGAGATGASVADLSYDEDEVSEDGARSPEGIFDRIFNPYNPEFARVTGNQVDSSQMPAEASEDASAQEPNYNFGQIDSAFDDPSDWEMAKQNIEKFGQHITKMSGKYAVPASLIKAVIATESKSQTMPYPSSAGGQICKGDSCVCNRNGYCGLMGVGPITQIGGAGGTGKAGLPEEKCDPENCKWDNFIKGDDGARDQIAAGTLSLKNSLEKNCGDIVSKDRGDYYYWAIACHKFGATAANELKSFAAQRTGKPVEQIEWKDVSMEDADNVRLARSWPEGMAEQMYSYPHKVMSNARRATNMQGAVSGIGAYAPLYVCKYEAVEYTKIGEYYVNPSFAVSLDYSAEDYNLLSDAVKEIVAECKDNDNDDIIQCVKDAAENHRSIGDDLEFYSGPCDYSENMLSDLAEWIDACMRSKDDNCTCIMLLEYGYQKADTNEEVTMTVSGTGVVQVSSPDKDLPSYSIKGSVNGNEEIKTKSGAEEHYAKKEGAVLTFKDDDSGKRCGLEKRSFKFCARTKTLYSVYDSTAKRLLMKPIEYKMSVTIPQEGSG